MVGKAHQFLYKKNYMPATVRSEFALALNQVATERGIDPDVVLDTIKAAILAAYRKDYSGQDIEDIEITIDPNSGEAKVFKDKKDITPAGFGRIAAQTAKQVILQRIREAEKKAIIEDYSTRVGTLVNGMVLRFDGPNVIVDIGRAEGIMPLQEQIPNEHYRLNQRLSVYIESIRQTMRGNEVIVSRSHKNLVAALFKREVPEVNNNAVEIKVIAREPGNRTKIAVFSSQSGVDPVGSCVGQKGVRVQAVINELSGMEKIDIIQWHDDPKIFIPAALSPAKNIDITINDKKMVAIAYVPEDQLSLAIGKDGQNVRLAAKLTGYKIDIKAQGEEEDKKNEEGKNETKKEKVILSEITELKEKVKKKAKKSSAVKKSTRKAKKNSAVSKKGKDEKEEEK